MAACSLGSGRITASQPDVIYTPRILRPDAPVAVYLHSGAGLPECVNGNSAGIGVALQERLSRLADVLGLAFACPTLPFEFGKGTATDATGTNTPQARLNDAITYHRASLRGHATKPIILLGSSSGSACALRRAGLDPTNVGCVVTFWTVPCLNVVVANDLGTNRSIVNTAYGRSAGDTSAFSAGICPTHGFSDTVPKLLTAGDADAYSTTAGHVMSTEWASGRGATVSMVAGAGHASDAAVSGISVATILGFVAPYAI